MSSSTSSPDTIAYRLSAILQRLNAGETLVIKRLADEFGVTERTVRRDLNERFNFLGLVWCLKSNHQIIELAARATDAKMVSALLCHTHGLGSSW